MLFRSVGEASGLFAFHGLIQIIEKIRIVGCNNEIARSMGGNQDPVVLPMGINFQGGNYGGREIAPATE